MNAQWALMAPFAINAQGWATLVQLRDECIGKFLYLSFGPPTPTSIKSVPTEPTSALRDYSKLWLDYGTRRGRSSSKWRLANSLAAMGNGFRASIGVKRDYSKVHFAIGTFSGNQNRRGE